MAKGLGSVVVVFNALTEEGYDQLKTVDPATLGFVPEYDIAVSTVTEEYMAIVKGLRAEGFRVRYMNLKDDLAQLERVVKRSPPDVVFNLVESFRDDPEYEAAVAAFLDLHGVAYTGAPPLALAMCRRKGLTKRLLVSHGVPTPRFLSLWKPAIAVRHGLRYPLIVKPAREDASAGVDRHSVVHDRASLLERLEAVFKEYEPPILVEEFIEGRELHVGIVGNDPPEMLPPLEYDFSELPEGEPAIISFAAKWDPLAEVFHRVGTRCPAPLTKQLEKRLRQVCIDAYNVMGCRDYARLDIRISTDNQPYVLEINPNPDLTEGVSFMESAEQAGYGFTGMLRHIALMGMARKRPKVTTPAPPPKPTVVVPGKE